MATNEYRTALGKLHLRLCKTKLCAGLVELNSRSGQCCLSKPVAAAEHPHAAIAGQRFYLAITHDVGIHTFGKCRRECRPTALGKSSAAALGNNKGDCLRAEKLTDSWRRFTAVQCAENIEIRIRDHRFERRIVISDETLCALVQGKLDNLRL